MENDQKTKTTTDQPTPRDLNRATAASPQVTDVIADMFNYHAWDEQQMLAGIAIREALKEAVTLIIDKVPPCPDRSAAIRKLREARMDCNSAITHRGKY